MSATRIQRLTPVDEAKRIVLEQAATLGTEQVALRDGIGRVLAHDLLADTALPPFDNSAMDGYAIRSADVVGATAARPVTLRLVGEVAAGQVFDQPVRRGEAVQIMTGAPLPQGADGVVMLEAARLRGGLVEVFNDVPPGMHVRRAGEDIRAGQLALSAGTRIRLAHLGLLAGLGCARVGVYRLPRVAVLATGSELVEVDEPLAPGKIRNANSLMLGAFLRRLGIEPLDLGVVVDERALIRQQLEEAAQSDVLLISGGVSVGEHDLVKRVLRDLGMETLFWRVNMKPGKPLLFGRLRKSVVFGLPGNPISCVVCFLEFIAPFLRRMMGASGSDDGRIAAELTRPLRKKEPRAELFTAWLEADQGRLSVRPTPQQGSGMLNSLATANALIVLPEEVTQREAGDLVDVLPLWEDPWRS
jgi:molybdopterin molybdotransferase